MKINLKIVNLKFTNNKNINRHRICIVKLKLQKKGGVAMDIGGKIKRMRIEKQLTQEELANRCELSKGFISQLENNLTSPSIATLIDILDILGTNLREFFNEISDEKITFTKDDMFETEDEDLKYTLKWLVPNS